MNLSCPDYDEDGYELFEENSTIQVKCPICHEVVRNPYFVSCCDHNFCYDCIMKLPLQKVVVKEVEKEDKGEDEENEEGVVDQPAAKMSLQQKVTKKCELCHANYNVLRNCPMCRKTFCENCIKRN